MIKSKERIAIFLISCSLVAFTKVKTTLSTSYKKNQEEKSQYGVNFNLNYNQFSLDGISSSVDMGVNNTFVQDEWKAYPYQFNFRYDLKNPKIGNWTFVLGRQLLLEGFGMRMLDGIHVSSGNNPFYNIYLYSGGLPGIDEREITFQEKIYGTQLALSPWDFLKAKAGFEHSTFGVSDRTDGIWGMQLYFTDSKFSPLLLYKQQYSFDSKQLEQELLELDSSIGGLNLTLKNIKEKPNTDILKKKNILFRIFSVSSQTSQSVGMNYSTSYTRNFYLNFEHTKFTSIRGQEWGEMRELGMTETLGSWEINPSVSALKSYGGELFSAFLGNTLKWSQNYEFELDFEASKIDKINGIEGNAYYTRASAATFWSKEWKAQMLVEVGKNHLFEIDSRGIFYVSHYY